MIDRHPKRLRLTPESSVPAGYGSGAEQEDATDNLGEQESQCDCDHLRIAWNPCASWSLVLFSLCVFLFVTDRGADAFVIPVATVRHYCNVLKVDTKLRYQDEYRDSEADDEEEDANRINSNSEEKELWGGDADLDSPSKTADDLSWKIAKIRLEQENTRRFLKAGPRFLPYDECRNWVKSWNRWDTEEDWKDWIREGEKRNAYIPARPDEYYARLGKWRGWSHFLGREEVQGGNEEDKPVGEGDSGAI